MVKNPSQRDIPAFYSPLTHDDHARLGRIAVLWGQVDMFVDNLLASVLDIKTELRAKLFDERPVGAKIDVLRSFMPNLPPAERGEVQSFLTMVDQAKRTRNRCFHGVWGYRVTRGRKVEPAAQHHRNPETAFKASELPALERKLCQISHQGMRALVALGEQKEMVVGAYPLFHGEIADREWFWQWLEQHHADHQTPHDSWKPGRLPFLAERPKPQDDDRKP